jgi:hypothetical protein
MTTKGTKHMNINKFRQDRQTAGDRYRTAFFELVDALAELHAYDLAAMNRHLPVPEPLAAFQGDPRKFMEMLQHPEFLPLNATEMPAWQRTGQDRADQIIRDVERAA